MAISTHLMVPGRPSADSWIEDNLDGKALGDCYFNAQGHKYRMCKIAPTGNLTGTALVAGDVVMWRDCSEYEITDLRASALNPDASANIYVTAGVCEQAITGVATDTSATAICILIAVDGPVSVTTAGGANIRDGVRVMRTLADTGTVSNYGTYPGARTEYDWMNLLYGIVGTALADEAASAVDIWVKPSAF